MRSPSSRLAVTYSLSASLCFAFLAYLVKYSAQFLPNAVLIFFRQCFGLLFLLPIIRIKLKTFKALKTRIFPLHMLRTFASLSAMFCLYIALRELPLTEAVLLSYTRPLFIPIVVYCWFRTPWTRYTWIGLFTGFLGIILVLQPGGKIFNPISLIGLGSGILGALAFTTIRRLTHTEPSERITFYYMALSLPLALIPLAKNWETPSLHGWLLLVLVGLLAIIYQLFLSRAYRHAKAFQIGSLLYSSVGFTYFLDFLLGNRIFSIYACIGIVMIILGSMIALKEQQHIE